MTDYKRIPISEELLKEVDFLIKNHPNLGYSSKSQFVTDAVRTQIKVSLGIIKEIEKLKSKTNMK